MRAVEGDGTRAGDSATRGIACLLVLAAAVAVALTYPSMSQTIDEATHVAAGLEWLRAGSYRLQPETPPLLRVGLALGPLLDGALPVASIDLRNDVLRGDPSHPRLWYARSANLLALAATAALVFRLAARTRDRVTALVAVLLFVTLPPVLAHAGLATTDMGLCAAVMASLLAWMAWLERPGARRAVALGIAAACAVLSKFSALPFLAAAGGLVLVAHRALRETAPERRAGRSLLVAGGCALLVLWAGYRFSLGSLASLDSPAAAGDLGGIRAAVIPAPELFRGLGDLLAHAARGHQAYLLGEVRTTGWWYFFPVALAVKTPLPFLVLVAIGIATNLRGRPTWQQLVPLLGVAGILLVSLPSRLNIGVRHVLPVYPMLCVVAASGALALARARRLRAGAVLGLAALLLWQIGGALAAHPSYLSYFNALAGDTPESILVDSDLDWGQDVDRLLDELDRRGIERVSLLLFTTMGVSRARLPAQTRMLQAGDRASGWVAASLFHIKVTRSGAWLEAYEPEARIGSSILLYDIPASEAGGRHR